MARAATVLSLIIIDKSEIYSASKFGIANVFCKMGSCRIKVSLKEFQPPSGLKKS